MDKLRLRFGTCLSWIAPAIVFIAIVLYLIFGGPADFATRLWIIIVAFALIGIPLGIKYGVQDKFWT